MWCTNQHSLWIMTVLIFDMRSKNYSISNVVGWTTGNLLACSAPTGHIGCLYWLWLILLQLSYCYIKFGFQDPQVRNFPEVLLRTSNINTWVTLIQFFIRVALILRISGSKGKHFIALVRAFVGPEENSRSDNSFLRGSAITHSISRPSLF